LCLLCLLIICALSVNKKRKTSGDAPAVDNSEASQMQHSRRGLQTDDVGRESEVSVNGTDHNDEGIELA
jgi:hypothetical protein